MIYNTLIIGHKSDKCNLSSLRQQQPARGAGQNELRQTESRHVKWRTWCSVLGSDSGRRFVPSAKMKKVLDTKCQLDIFYCTITTRTHTHTHQHRHTHRQSTQRQQRTRSHRNDFLEAPKSMLELLSLSHTLALALTHTHRETEPQID